jgi:HTH-type transcriptional regulator/antitoxin HigA
MPSTARKSSDDFLNDPDLAQLVSLLPKYLCVPTTEEEYDHLQRLLDHVLDSGGMNETHPLADVAAVIGTLMQPYEEVHYAIPDASPVEMLRFFMDQHDLKQKDLVDIFGTPSLVSEVLNGKRDLTKKQIAALAERFHVSPAVFF